ncbi:hypothetical protein [Nocardia seriolae]|nr:hypothetical protein [Nocardia seriolae]MTJ60428.1 hypothetical protein [Nocardia seriolae]MTJ75822.1 hypothetical protein [Nocardia seriolae]MTJ84682.1 hypothetical protein [Nocardia seriolae]MTK28670.1 hypothetical protein [Nocardia seriolae]MTK38412.1 hypothetical protein [Nocardia seriolae]
MSTRSSRRISKGSKVSRRSNPPPHPGQPRPPQGQQGQPWPEQGQGWSQQGQPWAGQGQGWQQPGPGFSPPGVPPQPWGAPPPGTRRPIWRSPIVLIAGGLVLLLLVVGLVFAIRGDDSGSTGAAASTSITTQSRTGAPSTTRTSAKPTTTTKTPAPVPPAVQPIVDALPAPLRKALLQNDIRPKPADDMFGYDAAAAFTLSAHDPQLKGLMHWPDNDYYPLAYISTQPDNLRHIWGSQHPEWTSDEGTRLVRIDPGDQYTNGAATLEVFVPGSGLYLELSGFASADAAKQFVQRAGF